MLDALVAFDGVRMVVDDWSVQLLRVSLFSSEPIPASEAGWKSLTGQDEAENRVAVPGGRQYSGSLYGGLLALTYAAPNRVDVIHTVDATKSDPTLTRETPVVVGKWPDVAKVFAGAVEPFIETLEVPIYRMAFGANLLGLGPSRAHTYSRLASLLKSVNVDVNNMRELIFRINWPQISEVVPDLEINRITTWSSLMLQTNTLQTTPSGLVVVESGTPPLHAVNLEIDHNTTADRKDRFEKQQLIPIFRELVTLAEQNASHGERP